MTFPFAGGQAPGNDPDLNDHFVQANSSLTMAEVDRVREIGDALESTSVKLYGRHDESHVRASGSHFPLVEGTRWLYERMMRETLAINERSFRYDLWGFHENFYYLRYEAPGEHFDWHLDIGGLTPAPRKLSLVLQLSSPDEYEGGDFDVLVARDHERAPKGKGIITAFPAYKVHRVTPVTRGVRRTLALFAAGPNFR